MKEFGELNKKDEFCLILPTFLGNQGDHKGVHGDLSAYKDPRNSERGIRRTRS